MQVETAPEFEALAKRLGKTYRLVHQDVEKLIADLEHGVRPQDARLQKHGRNGSLQSALAQHLREGRFARRALELSTASRTG